MTPRPKPARQVHSHQVLSFVREPAVERQQQHERHQEQDRADRDGAGAVDVERVDVGDDVGAVADLVGLHAVDRLLGGTSELRVATARI